MTERPEPDALREQARAEGESERRGRLKIFFGAAPGVGKTYAMLEAARKAQAEGVDVAVGWIETHGRRETADLAEGLERILVREIEHGGIKRRELDLDAALARRPAVLLLDELAHTNAPGVRHAKRWQDARELLEAGIDVYTTLNVQHIESLNDIVNQITGIAVRETIPDHVLEQADEVELVDLPPEDLLKRLAEGRVYVPEQAERATHAFFRKGNLIALRELALRRAADRIDAQMQDYRRDHAIERTWPVAERVLVCVRPHPESPRLVRTARGLASRLRAEWIVAYVESPSQRALSTAEREALAATMKLAEELGAKTAVLSGESVAGALLAFARERNVSRIVVGKPAHPRWRDRLRGGSLLDEIVRGSGEIDVYFIAGDGSPRAHDRLARRRARHAGRLAYVRAGAAVTVCTLVSAAMFPRFDKSTLVMVYLLGVAFVATRYGRGPSAFAACVSVALFNFFFVPPRFTFAVADPQYLVVFAVMLVVGLLISNLAARVKDQAEAAQSREQRTQILYAMSRELAGIRSGEEIAATTCRHVAAFLRGPAVLMLPDGDGRLAAHSPDAPEAMVDDRAVAVAQWVMDHDRPAGLGTDTLPGAAALYVPLRSAGRCIGVLGAQPAASLRPLTPEQTGMLETLVHLASSAIERARLASESERAQLAAERERLRSTLLSSVSHDFRTPLAAITGAASLLLDDPSLDAAAQRDLEETIQEEAERLNRLITNLLDMTRLESGAVALRQDWHSLEEVVGSALARIEKRLGGRLVETDIPADLPLVRVDASLLEQVFVNLLENAIKYTPPSSVIRIAARGDGSEVKVSTADDGPGLPAGAEERVFDKFYRGTSAGGQKGVGLGLAICRAIVSVHGGRMWAESGRGGGAAFHFTLPARELPALPKDEAGTA